MTEKINVLVPFISTSCQIVENTTLITRIFPRFRAGSGESGKIMEIEISRPGIMFSRLENHVNLVFVPKHLEL